MITTELPAHEERKSPVAQLEHLAKEVERQTSRIQPRTLIAAAGASIVLSLAFRLLGRKHEALFIGQWAPTLLLLGVYNQVSKSPFQKAVEP